ncbi:MAG: ribose 5-phosphate isomerase B [Bacteroidetes bacterium]|jgi:ribose 5-phosphate isomerase B|nr:ribose 5-phosphate isomerase B [Bacteroidota bacterium]
MNIAIACDHAGYEYKEAIKLQLAALGHEVKDFGTHSLDSMDYPDTTHPAANAVETKACELGILICGSANGVAMTANKHQGIRAAICWEAELSKLARTHNDANMVCLPARFISLELAQEIVALFISTPFEGGRHANRVAKIAC